MPAVRPGVVVMSDLPSICRISRSREDGNTTATCWFDSGARLRYRECDDGSVRVEVFRAFESDPFFEAVEVGPTDACVCLVSALDLYHDHWTAGGPEAFRAACSTIEAVLLGPVEEDQA